MIFMTPLPVNKKKPKTPKKKSLSKLKKQLDQIYSQYIRQSSANKQGLARCYTCSKEADWKELQCGHFISRSSLATRFMEENTKVQCVGCNVFGSGRPVIFAERLQKEYGKDIIEKLYKEARKIVKYFPYEEKIKYYTSKLQELSK